MANDLIKRLRAANSPLPWKGGGGVHALLGEAADEIARLTDCDRLCGPDQDCCYAGELRAKVERLRAQRDRNWGLLSPENKKKLADQARTDAAKDAEMTPDILAEVAEQAEMIAAQPDADSWFDLLEASVTHISEEMNDDEPTDAKVRDELVQTAGVAIAFIRAIDGKEKPTEHRYCFVFLIEEKS